MMFKPAIQKATLTCLALAVSGPSAIAQMADASAVQLAAASRMSTSLSAMPEFRAPEAGPKSVPLAAVKPVSTDAGTDNRFDLAVKNAPASQVYLQLGMGSRYNLLVPQDLDGRVTLNLKNVTLMEALDTLRDLYGYDYRVTGNRIYVQSNTVQIRIFRINYLPGRRNGSSELVIASTNSSAQPDNKGGGGSGGAAGNAGGTPAANGNAPGGSGNGQTATLSMTSAVHTATDADFWRDVRESLESLVGNDNGRRVTVNPAAGVIVVRASPAELRQVADYLRAVQITVERQVMLEAKIVEVQLSKGSETGINWQAFRTNSSGSRTWGGAGATPNVTLTSNGVLSDNNASIYPGAALITQQLGKGFYGLAFQSATFAGVLTFLETQGNVQVLSSPRIAALNNQKAVLKVGSDDSFVVSVTNTPTVVNNQTVNNVTAVTKNYFSGISLDVTPQIDENGAVMLHVHPAISMTSLKNMTVSLNGEDISIPGVTVAVNETDSMVRVKDGQIAAIGGLMQQTASNNSSGVPGLSNAPVVGNLFKYKTTSNVKRELVILIKPTVLTDETVSSTATLPQADMLDGIRQ